MPPTPRIGVLDYIEVAVFGVALIASMGLVGRSLTAMGYARDASALWCLLYGCWEVTTFSFALFMPRAIGWLAIIAALPALVFGGVLHTAQAEAAMRGRLEEEAIGRLRQEPAYLVMVADVGAACGAADGAEADLKNTKDEVERESNPPRGPCRAKCTALEIHAGKIAAPTQQLKSACTSAKSSLANLEKARARAKAAAALLSLKGALTGLCVDVEGPPNLHTLEPGATTKVCFKDQKYPAFAPVRELNMGAVFGRLKSGDADTLGQLPTSLLPDMALIVAIVLTVLRKIFRARKAPA